MALKRTRVPFYGKRESRLAAFAGKVFRAGDIEYANHLHFVIRASMEQKRVAWRSTHR